MGISSPHPLPGRRTSRGCSAVLTFYVVRRSSSIRLRYWEQRYPNTDPTCVTLYMGTWSPGLLLVVVKYLPFPPAICLVVLPKLGQEAHNEHNRSLTLGNTARECAEGCRSESSARRYLAVCKLPVIGIPRRDCLKHDGMSNARGAVRTAICVPMIGHTCLLLAQRGGRRRYLMPSFADALSKGRAQIARVCVCCRMTSLPSLEADDLSSPVSCM